MWHYHELVPLHSRILPPINKFYTALIFIYSFLISTGVSYIFFTTKSVTMTGHFFLLLPDLKWNQPIYIFTSRGKNVFLGVPYIPLKFVQTALKHPVCVCVLQYAMVSASKSRNSCQTANRAHISELRFANPPHSYLTSLKLV